MNWGMMKTKEGNITEKKIQTRLEPAAAVQIRKGNEAVHADVECTRSSRYPDGFRILMGTQEYVSYRDHSQIRVWTYDNSYACPRHYHSAVEIVICMEGKINFRVEDMTYHLTAGNILIIPPKAGHEMENEDGTRRHIILFEQDVLSGLRDLQLITHLLRSPILIDGNTPEGAEEYALLIKLAECYRESRPLWNMQCYAILIEFYALLGEKLLSDKKSPWSASSCAIGAELMNSVLVYIEQNQDHPLSLEQVANFAGFSKFYFSRVFNAYAGMSFTEYLNRRRLAQADHLLITTREPVNEIARRVGFGSMATFSRVFTSVHNCTPSRFRQIYAD